MGTPTFRIRPHCCAVASFQEIRAIGLLLALLPTSSSAVEPSTDHDVVIVGAEDNLLKGAAVQAVQNLNLALGLAELTGIATGSE